MQIFNVRRNFEHEKRLHNSIRTDEDAARVVNCLATVGSDLMGQQRCRVLGAVC